MPCTISSMDMPTANRIRKPLATIFATAISLGRTGMTSKCSMVPRSRSRITAAPTSTTDSTVTLLMTCMIEVNQLVVLLGLNITCTTERVGNMESKFLTRR